MVLERFDPDDFRRTIVENTSDPHALAQTAHDYQLMLGCVLEAMLQRYERREGYHFVDTKLDLRSGEDFPEDDPVRGPGVIYVWIQGRGLEALVGHARWLERCEEVDPALRERLLPRIRRMVAEVFEQMESLRAANAGRLFFTMTPEGQPLKMADDGRFVPHEVPPDSPANTTELFYVKGMLAAADFLAKEAKVDEARRWYEQIDRDIRASRLRSDQQPLDPTNAAVKAVPGRRGNGGRMLALGAAGLFLECTGQAVYRDMGLVYLDYLLKYHVNTAPNPELGQQFDAWEFVDEQGRPFIDADGALLSDPGHVCEQVGFALKFLTTCQRHGLLDDIAPGRLEDYYRILPAMLERNFANGFSPSGVGIVKAYDLLTRRPLRQDCPWWSLPETMRAALFAARVVKSDRRDKYIEIAAKCSNAFLGRYVRPELHLMAYQTLDRDGQPMATIPATPDADPGYHTGLSIIDYLDLLDGLAC